MHGFLDNVVKSSNALLKDRLNNPFANKQSNNQQETNEPNEQQAQAAASSNQTNTDTSIERQQQPEPSTSQNNSTSSAQNLIPDNNDESSNNKNSQFAAIAADAEVVTQKAVKGAKTFGTFLFSMANKAGQTVTQTAKQVKQVVENTSILTDLTREQQEFIREHGGSLQAGELPWSNCEDETKTAEIREQVLSLSQDKRNFVRSPPNDSDFKFDPKASYPIALSLLKEDPNLSKMRFELVPKLVNEDTFWCNYFYRVAMLKQMSEKGSTFRQGWASSRSSSGEGPDEVNTGNDVVNQNDDASPVYTSSEVQQTNVVAQESLNLDTSTNTNIDANIISEVESSESRIAADDEDLKRKLRELNIGSFDGGDQDENDKWEEELQRDLQEFELLPGDVSALDEEALDEDIMELKHSAKKDAS